MSEEKNEAKFDSKELGLFGKKVGMAQVFDEEGNAVPVTVVKLGENQVTGIKTQDKDGYDAVQVGNFEDSGKHLTKPEQAHLSKNKLPMYRLLKEFRTPETLEIKVGDKVDPQSFFDGLEKVKVTAKSIGKGFQGGVKLHNHSIGRRSHGSKSKRQIGSIGAGTTPSRVYKGRTMPSMMGNRVVTLTKVKVVKYVPEENLVLLKGPVPGKAGAIVGIKPYGIKSWNHNNKK